MSIELGKKLSALRKDNALTQKQIADILHINRATYAYYERGDTEPDLKTLVRLSRMFNVDPSHFLPNLDYTGDLASENSTVGDLCATASRSKAGSGGTFSLDAEEKTMLFAFRSLNAQGRESVYNYAVELAAKMTAEKNTDRPRKKD